MRIGRFIRTLSATGIIALLALLARPAASEFPDTIRGQGDAAEISADGQVGGLTGGLAARDNHVYLGYGPRLVILDLSKIELLSTFDDIVVGRTDPFPGIVRDVVLEGNYAYVAAGKAGLRIIDISDPAAPREVGALDVTENAVAIDNTGTTIYLGDYGPSGLHVIDAADPAAPRELGAAEWRAGIWSITAAGDYAYVADGYEMFIFDVGDPTAPRQIGHVGTGCSALDVAVVGTMAYIADHDNCGLLLADVSDPTVQTHQVYADPEDVYYLNPTLPAREQHDSLLVEAAGGYIYVVNSEVIYRDDADPLISGHLTVFDIGNPRAPEPVARYNLDRNGPYREITDLTLDGNFAYLSHADGGLYVVDLSDFRVSNNVTSIPAFGPVAGVVADGGEVLAAAGYRLHHGFEHTMEEAGSFLSTGLADRAIELTGEDGLGFLTTTRTAGTVDLHGFDPLWGPLPMEIGSYEVPERPFRTAADGDRFLLFYEHDKLLHSVDATNPLSPVELGVVSVPDSLSSGSWPAYAGNGIAYLDYWESPPWMIDLRGDTPVALGFLGDVRIKDLAISGDIAYAVDVDGGLARYDVADPAAPRRLDPLPGLETANAVHRAGPWLFIGDTTNRIHVLDTTAAEPATVAVLAAPYEMRNAAVIDGRVFVAAFAGGLWSYSVPGLTAAAGAAESKMVFNDLPLGESLLLYIDSGGDLVLEDVGTGAAARLTEGRRVTGFAIAPTRDRIRYTEQNGRTRVLALEFQSDGRLIAEQLPARLPIGASNFVWSPAADRLAFRDTGSTWWIFDLARQELPVLLPYETRTIGDWSHDGQWLSYCTTEGELGIIDPAGTTETIDENVSCMPILGSGPAWSPTALQLAYVRGEQSFLSTPGLQPVVHDGATNAYYELAVDHTIMEWSPDGRYLAIGNGFVGNKGFTYESVSIVQPATNTARPIGSYDSFTFGEIGWLETAPGEQIFNNLLIADDLSAADPIADALFDISSDGTRWVTGTLEGESLEVFCGPPDNIKQSLLYTTTFIAYPDEFMAGAQTGVMQPGVAAALSPRGTFLTLRTYQGGNDWLVHVLPCNPDTPLPMTGQTVWDGYAGAAYSAGERWLILASWMSGGVDRRIDLYDATKAQSPPLRAFPPDMESYAWLITPDAAPSVTEVNAIAGRVTDHTGAPIPGARVRAGDMTTTTDAGGRYRFGDLEDGSYTVAAELVGYVFSAPIEVVVPPAQMAVDFAAEPPAAYTLTGRVADCAGRPVSGATVSFDLSGNGAGTNADGRYTIEGLERKSYTLTAAAEGYDFVPATRAVHLARYAAGETLTVDFTATTSGSDDFCIPHLEIIQVVQDEFNSAPIIADKPALLRAYVHCPACDPDETITGTLEAFRPDDGTAIPAPGAPLIAEMSEPGPGFLWPTHRGDLEQSLNFLLPPEWLAEGDTRFRVSANGASTSLDVTFELGKPLRIYHVPYTYMLPSDPQVPIPAPTPLPIINESLIIDGYDALVAILPIAPDDLEYEPATSVRQRIDVPFDQHGTPRRNAEAYLDALNKYWLRQNLTQGWRDNRPPDRLIGWVANSKAHSQYSGIADSRYRGNNGTVAAVVFNDGTTLGMSRFTRTGVALVHELGHLLDDTGLWHTPFVADFDLCDETVPQDTTTNFPAFLIPGSIGDIGIHINGGSFDLLSPSGGEEEPTYYDIMTYCDPKWISIFNYKRFHEGFMPVATAPATPNAAPEPHLLISGRVISSTQTADIDPVFQIQAVAPPSPDTPGDTCVELRDATDVMQERRCFAPVFREGITGGPTDAAGFTLAVPWVEGATSVVVTRDNRVLGRVEASPAPPAVDAAAIAGELSADGQLMTVRWDGNDPDGDELVYTLSLRGERGLIPLAFDIHEEEVSFDTRQLPGDEPLHIVIEASDGFHSARSESAAPMVLPTKPPSVSITPMPESQLTAGRPFWAFGMAHDVEDGPLPEDALVWSVDGRELGRGPQLFATLPAGEYTLTLTATDSDGGQASAEWPVYVIENSGPEEKEPNPEGNAATLRRLIGWVAIGSGAVFVIGVLLLLLGRRK